MLPSLLNSLRPSIYAALIDKPCAELHWLGRSTVAWTTPSTNLSSTTDLLATSLDQLLSSRTKTSKKWLPSPGHMSLILPDSVARFEMLPWTASLMLPDELRQFAIERFEMVNQSVRDGWTVHAEWKRAGANILAYALPHDVLDGLQRVAQQHGLMLDRALPLSALAHYGQLSLMNRNELRLVQCRSSTCALLYVNGKLVNYFMETVRGTTSDSLKRLISRLQMSELSPDFRLNRLALVGVEPIHLQEIIDTNKPTKIRMLNPLRWAQWQ
ncbi:hypothetical protein AAKU67_003985 [Oxalobacteraceae bacterium GrIS 2.11]